MTAEVNRGFQKRWGALRPYTPTPAGPCCRLNRAEGFEVRTQTHTQKETENQVRASVRLMVLG